MERTEILRILGDWNYWGSFQDESIERNKYTSLLADYIKTGEIVALKGVRRSGKSTIISQFINNLIKNKKIPAKNTLLINFEDPRFRKMDLDLLNEIYEIYCDELLPDKDQYIVLDEVQAIAGWEKFARFLSEAKKINVIVTGSSSKLLSEEYSTLLSGRHIDLEIYPLSFREYLAFNKIPAGSETENTRQRHIIKNLLGQYMTYGAFPKVALVNKNEKKLILANYYSDIMLKDVQMRYKIREASKLEDLAKYYLTNTSTVQPFNRLKSVIGLSLDSVERFSRYFSIAGLFFFTQKFSFSGKEQLLNPKKVYSVDTGLRNIIGFRFSEDYGRLMENIIFLELKRRGKEVYYWKSLKQKEADFVVKDGLKIRQIIQACYDTGNPETKKREIAALLECGKYTGCNDLSVITYDYEAMETHEKSKVKFISLWRWLLSY